MRTVKLALSSLVAAGAVAALAACGSGSAPTAAGINLPAPAVAGSTAPGEPTAAPAPNPPTSGSTHHGSSGNGGSAGGSTANSASTSSSPAPAIPGVNSIDVVCRGNAITGIQLLRITYSTVNADSIKISSGSWSTTTTNADGSVGAPNAGCYAANGTVSYTIVATQTATGLSATKTIDHTGTAPAPVSTRTTPPVLAPRTN